MKLPSARMLLKPALMWQHFNAWLTAPERHPQGARHPLWLWLMLPVLLWVCWRLGFASSLAGTMFSQRPLLLAVLPLLLVLGFAVLFNRPGLLLLILVFRAGLDPLLEQTKIPLGGSSMGLGGVLNGLIIMLTVWMILERRGAFKVWPLARFFAPFLLMVGISITYSPTVVDSIKLYLNLITYLCAFLLGGFLVQQRDLSYVMRVIVVSSLVPVLISMVMLASGVSVLNAGISVDGAFREDASRFYGPFTHPNIFAFYILLVVTCAVVLLETQKHSRQVTVLAWSYIAVLSFCLLKTQTRSAWAAYGVVMFLYALGYNRKLLLPMALAAVLALLTPEVRDRLMDLHNDRSYLAWSKLNSYEWRKNLWAEGLSWLPKKNYLFGMGMGAFYVNSKYYFNTAGGVSFWPHSVYVQNIFDHGVVSLVFFIYLMLAPLREMVKYFAANRLLFFASVTIVIAYCMVCYSDNVMGYLVYNIYHWLLLGALFSAMTPSQEKA